MKSLYLSVLGAVITFHALSLAAVANSSYSQADLKFLTEVEQRSFEAGLEVEQYNHLISAAQQKNIALKVCRSYEVTPGRQPLQDVVAKVAAEVFKGPQPGEIEKRDRFTTIVAIAGVQTYCPNHRNKF